MIAHDRRGHGRSSQTADGHDMDTYAADVARSSTALDLRDAIHVGHSTGGGEATRYVARHGKGRVGEARADRRGAADHGEDRRPIRAALPIEVFDGLRAQLAANRAQFYWDVPIGPFYGFNRPGATVDRGGASRTGGARA